ncbi:hypothetical protein HPB49_019582 [Dermacentor silvarum]|uniref:Uncharacterized protein n=1 Tax=Dermacentor silvarum TaxID=543639 RepID=A0ACB8E2J3_DERSI|nr:hypothetical protein HPB49_019582 [Dermacentor silvarum]
MHSRLLMTLYSVRKVLAFTLLGWTSASGRATSPAAPYPASGTTTAAQSPAVALRPWWGANARTRVARSPADPPAGLSDDWSTRLSAAAPRTPTSREKPPPPTLSTARGPQKRKPASNVATATTTLPVASQPSEPRALTETSPERASTARVVVRRKPLLPDDRSPRERVIAPSLEPHASSVVYEASAQAHARKAAHEGRGEASNSPDVRVYASAFSEKLVASDEKQGNQQAPSRAARESSKSARRTITIPYNVPQRAVVSGGTNGQRQLDNRPHRSACPESEAPCCCSWRKQFCCASSRLSAFAKHAAPSAFAAANSEKPQRTRVPPQAWAIQCAFATSTTFCTAVSSFIRAGLPALAIRWTGREAWTSAVQRKMTHSYFREFPYADDTSSYEENERHEPHGQRSEAARVPYRRPLFTFPKPIDFGLSKMNQKGCKTTVKELKHVSKDALGVASSHLHSLFRPKRGVPSEPKMTSIIMTKECFFPEDPASGAGNVAAIAQPKENGSPARYENPSSQRTYLSNYDPQSRSTHNTPTYNSYYPRPQNNRGWRTFASTPVFRASKFPTKSRDSVSASFEDDVFKETAPYASNRYDGRNLNRRGLRGSPSTIYGEDARDKEADSRDESSSYGWQGARRDFNKNDDSGGDDYGSQNRYAGRHEDSPQASGRKPRTRGPPPPKTSNRSFAFYRRDENPEKDHFVESYSTARRKTFASDYDSDRDGFFE